MRKRQFGKGKKVYASEHNIAQNYAELNIKEVMQDTGIIGIIKGGTPTPHSTIPHTIKIDNTVMRTSTGERIDINAETNIFLKPSVDPGIGNEIYVTAYAQYDYLLSGSDVDEDGTAYYKDYQNSYTISTIQGTIAPTGNAIAPSIPSESILICDILFDTTLFASGTIQQSDIDISRQTTYDVGIADDIQNATEKTPPVNNDFFGIIDSDTAWTLKKLKWSNIKNTLKTYFDTFYNNYIHPNHTGDVESIRDGIQTIVNDAVTNIKLDNMAQDTIKGRITTSTGDPEDLNATEVRSILNVEYGANNYALPIASSTGLGGIKVGSNLTINSSTGVLSATSGSGGGSAITVEDFTADDTLTSDETQKVCTNNGAAGEVILTIPATVAVEFTFIVRTTQYLRIKAPPGVIIRNGGTTSAAGGYFRSNTVGNVITIICVDSTEWVTKNIIGTWSVDS